MRRAPCSVRSVSACVSSCPDAPVARCKRYLLEIVKLWARIAAVHKELQDDAEDFCETYEALLETLAYKADLDLRALTQLKVRAPCPFCSPTLTCAQDIMVEYRNDLKSVSSDSLILSRQMSKKLVGWHPKIVTELQRVLGVDVSAPFPPISAS